MSAEPPNTAAPPAAGQPPRIGMVSLGCPKALVDSERILGRLRADGYVFSADYQGADAVIVNTCGFLDSAKAESLAAIGEAVRENGRVIVTGCMGADADTIRAAYPQTLAVTGAHAVSAVVDAVRAAAPIAPNPFLDLTPKPAAPTNGVEPRALLTPRHFAYLKISEGCDHRCRFCIIPRLRGGLVSRPAAAVLREAEQLVAGGVKELLIISQDTSAYGKDVRHAASSWRGASRRAHIQDLAEALGELGVWVRLHYVYPYPHVDALIPLMADGRITPYIDIPFQHASPRVLKAMRRPAKQERTLERIAAWRAEAPDLAIRSTFIVGFPGETEADFEMLLTWLEAAELDRVGCFKYENVATAAANDLPDHVPEEVKQTRLERFMETQQRISARRLAARVGRVIDVIVDRVDADGAEGRSTWDAPEIDGSVFIDRNFEALRPGDIARVAIDEASDHDLWGARV